jgi:hypothetical protein
VASAEADGDLGPLAMASIEFRTIYDSLVSYGFDDRQALYLLAAQITGNPGPAPLKDVPYMGQPDGEAPGVHTHLGGP